MARVISVADDCAGETEKKKPAYVQKLSLGRRSSEIVGDVFYGTDDAEGIDDYKYKEDVLEIYRREREKKLVRKTKKDDAMAGCFSFLKFFCRFR